MWELDYKESWAPKNWCFWTVVLEKILESPLNYKEIQPAQPKENQSAIFSGRTDAEGETPTLWPPDVKNWLSWKDPAAGKDWRQEEKGTAEDEMVWWHHQLNGHEFEWTLAFGMDREAWYAAVHVVTRVRQDWATELNWIEVSLVKLILHKVTTQYLWVLWEFLKFLLVCTQFTANKIPM